MKLVNLPPLFYFSILRVSDIKSALDLVLDNNANAIQISIT